MFSLKKLTRLLQVQMIINKWNQLTWQKHTYVYGTSKDLVNKKCSNIIKRGEKMKAECDFIKEETKKHNQNWSETPDHPYTILIIGVFGLEKTS